MLWSWSPRPLPLGCQSLTVSATDVSPFGGSSAFLPISHSGPKERQGSLRPQSWPKGTRAPAWGNGVRMAGALTLAAVERSRREKALAPKSPGRSQRSRGVPWQASPPPTSGETGGAVVGGQGPRGPSEWRGEREEGSPVRRRTPPAWWASGRPRRWPVLAPPMSSYPRLFSSSGTA